MRTFRTLYVHCLDNSLVIENVHSCKTVASSYIVCYHLSDRGSTIIRVDTLLNLPLFTYGEKIIIGAVSDLLRVGIASSNRPLLESSLLIIEIYIKYKCISSYVFAGLTRGVALLLENKQTYSTYYQKPVGCLYKINNFSPCN